MAANTHNGSIRLRNRLLEMKWLGEKAAHVLHEYLKGGVHVMDHLQIQQALRKGVYLKLKDGNNQWAAYTDNEQGRCVVFFQAAASARVALIRSGYTTGENMEQVKKSKRAAAPHRKQKGGVAGTAKGPDWRYVPTDGQRAILQRMVDDGDFSSMDALLDTLTDAFAGRIKPG